MQDHAPRCNQLSGCTTCWGCPECRSLNPCGCCDAFVGCPRCFEGAIGEVCTWHQAMERAGASTPAPVIVLAVRSPKPIMHPTLRPRNLDGSFQSRRVARQFQQLSQTVHRALKSAPTEEEKMTAALDRQSEQGFGELVAHGSEDLAVITRTMQEAWRDDVDPIVFVQFQHVNSRTTCISDLRLSQLERLVADISSAIATGRKIGALPTRC